MAVHAFTSFSFSYLDRARVLARSLRNVHSDWVLWGVLVDREPPGFVHDWAGEDFDRIIRVEDLLGDKAESWLFGHDLVEACTAIKGHALDFILASGNVDAVMYFDPDIALFNPMHEVVQDLSTASIVLTPHQTEPENAADRQAILDNEAGSLLHGVFNLGFIGVANRPEGRRFTHWWRDRLRDWCVDRRDIGIFVDQKWCNLVPCFFDEVKIIKDPGFNVASWNLSQRRVYFDHDGRLMVNDEPLKFYHFTKFGPVGAAMTARYAQDNAAIADLWWWYGRQLEGAKERRIPAGWWYYGEFSDGSPITRKMREIYRERPDLQQSFPHPFQVRDRSFLAWLRRHAGRGNLKASLREADR